MLRLQRMHRILFEADDTGHIPKDLDGDSGIDPSVSFPGLG